MYLVIVRTEMYEVHPTDNTRGKCTGPIMAVTKYIRSIGDVGKAVHEISGMLLSTPEKEIHKLMQSNPDNLMRYDFGDKSDDPNSA